MAFRPVAAVALSACIALSASFTTQAPAQGTQANGFVDAFADACVPERLTHAGTLSHVRKRGWSAAAPADDAELASVLAASDKELEGAREPGWVFLRAAFKRVVAGQSLFLIVTYVHAPGVITLGGCYLYDFNRTDAADQLSVSQFLGQPRARTTPDLGAVVHVWGPSKKLPRTLDTYLYEVPDGSALAKRAGFSGTMLKFETSLIKTEPAQ